MCATRALPPPATPTPHSRDAADAAAAAHSFFDSLHMSDHPVEDLVAPDATMTDHDVGACYRGFRAIKHRMQVGRNEC
jgi:hypothetical protein